MAKEKKRFIDTRDPIGQVFSGITLFLTIVSGVGMVSALIATICGADGAGIAFGILTGAFVVFLFMYWAVVSVSKIVNNTTEMNETLKEIRNSLKPTDNSDSETQQ